MLTWPGMAPKRNYKCASGVAFERERERDRVALKFCGCMRWFRKSCGLRSRHVLLGHEDSDIL